MRSIGIGHTEMTGSGVIMGMMRIGDLGDAEIRGLFDAARSTGINTFDHADIYGGETHLCETRFGDALSLTAKAREEIILQSKVGIRPG